MRELSLFSGAGGGLLGSLLLGWEPVGYVEINEYCQKIIRQRIDDGILPNAPIFGDLQAFNNQGYARNYQGMVDVISAGFPCQPFSNAGKQAGADDPRNMWPSTIESIRIIRPKFTFLENVPGLIATGYFNTVIGDLTESGYNCRWRVLSATELGAPHKRDRLWIVGHTICDRRNAGGNIDTQHDRHVINTTDQHASEMAYSNQNERQLHQSGIERQIQMRHDVDRSGSPVGDMGNTTSTQRGAKLQLKRPTWWATEPDVGRMANGVASRVDRLKAIGNGQVPSVAAAAWRLLTEDIL